MASRVQLAKGRSKTYQTSDFTSGPSSLLPLGKFHHPSISTSINNDCLFSERLKLNFFVKAVLTRLPIAATTPDASMKSIFVLKVAPRTIAGALVHLK